MNRLYIELLKDNPEWATAARREDLNHFMARLVFCFFANSVKLLPEGLLKKLIELALKRPANSREYFNKLFSQMQTGGEYDLTDIRWFNGGLFDGRLALKLEVEELALLLSLHSFRWDLIDPTIFGTLFERFLDPDKRAQIGAHYTDPDKIMQIVEPVILRPLKAEWAKVRQEIEATMAPVLAEHASGNGGALARRFNTAKAGAEAQRDSFIDRLCALRILDPACGCWAGRCRACHPAFCMASRSTRWRRSWRAPSSGSATFNGASRTA